MMADKENSRLKYSLFGFQMLARVIKNLLRAKLRAERVSQENCQKVIIDFFNLVLGKGTATRDFWSLTLPIQLLLVYGPFGFRFNDGDRKNLHFILGHLSLFHLLQEYTGIKFSHDVSTRLSPTFLQRSSASTEDFKPFKEDDLVHTRLMVKTIDMRSRLNTHVEKIFASPQFEVAGEDGTGYPASLKKEEKYLEIIKKIQEAKKRQRSSLLPSNSQTNILRLRERR